MHNPRVKLINARKSAGLTQRELAESIGISRAFLTNIELGKYTPSLNVAEQIASTLGCDIKYLFFADNVREKNIKNYQTTGKNSQDETQPTGTCG